MKIRHEIPETGFLVPSDSVRDVPEKISVDIHVTELLEVFSGILIKSCTENTRLESPCLGVETLIADSHTDCRSEPFAEVAVNAWSNLDIISFIPEYVDTSGCTDKPVIPKFICFIRASYNIAFKVPVSVLLSIQFRRGCQCDSDKSRSSKKIKTFHDHLKLIGVTKRLSKLCVKLSFSGENFISPSFLPLL